MSSLAAGPKSVRVVGVVVAKQATGVVIEAVLQRSASKPKGFVFLEGDFPKSFQNDKVSVLATDDGTFDYKTEQIRKMKVVK